ncbi:MAG: SgcJ/EcaC family oxidoreductase [Pseudomonadota bacterium]
MIASMPHTAEAPADSHLAFSEDTFMNRYLRSFVVGLTLGLTTNAFAQQSDVDAIRDLQSRQAAAWNHHDAAEYAGLFTANGDVVNVLGWWWRGRSEIKEKLTGAFKWVFRDSQLAINDVDVRLLDQTTAIAHVRWTMDGAKAPPGAPVPPREGIQMQILKKQGNAWFIESFQNTNSTPEAPFPTGPGR